MEVHTHRRAHTCEHPDGLPSAGDGDQHQHTEAKDVASVTAALGREGAGQCKDSAGLGVSPSGKNPRVESKLLVTMFFSD